MLADDNDETLWSADPGGVSTLIAAESAALH
jgi:hypothetical protein